MKFNFKIGYGGLVLLFVGFCFGQMGCQQAGSIATSQDHNLDNLMPLPSIIPLSPSAAREPSEWRDPLEPSPNARSGSGMVPDSTDSDHNDDASAGEFCKGDPIFLSPLDLTATQDAKIHNVAIKNFLVPKSIRNLEIDNVAGNLTVPSAIHVTSITSAAGEIHIQAGTIEAIKAVSGKFCIKAGEIGRIEAVAGRSKIVAKRISEIKSFAGRIQIHNALVENLETIAGHVCLYEGAQVSHFRTIAGTVGKCD